MDVCSPFVLLLGCMCVCGGGWFLEIPLPPTHWEPLNELPRMQVMPLLWLGTSSFSLRPLASHDLVPPFGSHTFPGCLLTGNLKQSQATCFYSEPVSGRNSHVWPPLEPPPVAAGRNPSSCGGWASTVSEPVDVSRAGSATGLSRRRQTFQVVPLHLSDLALGKELECPSLPAGGAGS